MTLNELYTKRANVWENAKNFLDSHRGKDGILSAEDGETYDRMEKEITDLSREIGRLERQAEIEKELSQPTTAPLAGRPEGEAKDKKTGRASGQYAKAMLSAIRSNFHQVSDVLQEGIDADGGYLVPEEWDNRLIEALDDTNIMRELGTKITTSGEHRINIASTKPAAAWLEEGGAVAFSDEKFEQKILDAHKLAVAVKVSEELLYDNQFDLQNHIITQFGKAISNAEEDAFLNGDGTGKPTGIFNAANGGQVAVTTDTVKLTSSDIINLIYSLKRPYRKNAAFIMNDAVIAAIRQLRDTTGVYLWQPSFQSGEPDLLCGYKVYTSQYAPALAVGAPAIAFGDFSYYNIGDRGTRSMQQLRELFAGNGMIGFVAKERVDGILVLPEAVQILNVKKA